MALLERAGPQQVWQERDQRRQVQLFAHGIGEIMGRVSPVFAILDTAAQSEPDIAEYRQRILAERLSGMTYFIRALERNGPLRPGLSAEVAAETVWAITSAETYRLLTVDRGWPAEQYERWLGDTLTAILLPPG